MRPYFFSKKVHVHLILISERSTSSLLYAMSRDEKLLKGQAVEFYAVPRKVKFN